MMVLELKCGNNHLFEGWFSNSEAFSRQKESGKIQCPICEDTAIVQVLSPVAIRRSTAREPGPGEPQDLAAQIQQFFRYVRDNFEEVGSEFAKEALKMHYGVTDKRNIRGTSTADEEKTLVEEGVEFLKIPLPKEED